MTLHKIWEICDCTSHLYYEKLDPENECLTINEYTGDAENKYKIGAEKVFSIRPEMLPELGCVIIASLE